MLRNVVAIGSVVELAVSLAAEIASSQPTLSATQIVDKNVAARGRLEKWRLVKTMSLEGKMGAGDNQRATLQVPGSATQVVGRKNPQFVLPSRPMDEVQLLFLMELERPSVGCNLAGQRRRKEML